MSKWIDKNLFQNFQKQKKNEADEQKTNYNKRSDIVWKTPERGTVDRPKVYEGRFLPDKKGNFYKKYSYHMFSSGEKWAFALCPKTYGMDKYCPFCSATSKLYQGSDADKKIASTYKRKDKFVCNFFIINDPRDADVDNDKKVSGTVKLYEFPQKVEMKLKEEITDTKNGYGISIFDPGENGHNFILKVLSTKKDARGKIWPDYSSSTFSRTSNQIGSDKEINKIIDKTQNIDDYIQNLKVNEKQIEKWLKNEMLYDLVENEFKVKTTPNNNDNNNDNDIDDIDDSAFNINNDDIEDSEILAELENL